MEKMNVSETGQCKCAARKQIRPTLDAALMPIRDIIDGLDSGAIKMSERYHGIIGPYNTLTDEFYGCADPEKRTISIVERINGDLIIVDGRRRIEACRSFFLNNSTFVLRNLDCWKWMTDPKEFLYADLKAYAEMHPDSYPANALKALESRRFIIARYVDLTDEDEAKVFKRLRGYISPGAWMRMTKFEHWCSIN